MTFQTLAFTIESVSDDGVMICDFVPYSSPHNHMVVSDQTITFNGMPADTQILLSLTYQAVFEGITYTMVGITFQNQNTTEYPLYVLNPTNLALTGTITFPDTSTITATFPAQSFSIFDVLAEGLLETQFSIIFADPNGAVYTWDPTIVNNPSQTVP